MRRKQKSPNPLKLKKKLLNNYAASALERVTKELGAPVADTVVKAVTMLIDKLAFNTEEEIYSIIKRMTPVKE